MKTGSAFPDIAIHYLESLTKRRECSAVVKYYEDNRSEIDELSGFEAGTILSLIAQAYASLDNYNLALKIARLAQTEATTEGDNVLLAEIFVTIGSILVKLGEHKEAEKAFRDAESIFRRNDHLEGQSRALNLLSGLYFKQNDYKNSMAVLTDALSIARRLKDTKKTSYMMGNLGRLYTFLGDFSEAKRHLQLNIDLSTELGDWPEVARAYMSLAYVQIQCDEFQPAEEKLEKALEHLNLQRSNRDKAVYLVYLGELYRRSGRYGESEKVLKEALLSAESMAKNTTLCGRTMRQLAELYISRNNISVASRYAARAMTIMEKSSNKVEVGALYKLKAVIADAGKDAAACHELFIKSFELLDEAGVRFEKADALLAAGQCSSFGSRKRLMYLFRTEEYYARNKMKLRHDKVGTLIQATSSNSSGSDSTVKTTRHSTAASEFLTESATIKQFLKQLPVIGKMDLPLLLTGETGVGKDHLAEYYHNLVRPGTPFVAINCASFPETLLESELFGHMRGAFTGAEADKPGLFVTANYGVLLLDEIGDMPLSLQAKLLGVLERKKVIPLGSTSEIDLDVRLVAATNRDLESMVEDGEFRRDLYYRLSGITFQLQPLRQRKEDIPKLLAYFMRNSNLLEPGHKVPPEMLKLFLGYSWPGNVRELQNKVMKLEIMAQMVTEGDLVELTRSLLATVEPEKEGSLTGRVEEFERQLILEALLAANGNKSHAARMLGIHEATVRTKLKRYGISLAG